MDEVRQIPIALPSLGFDEWHAMCESFETGWLTQGPKVAEFEQAFAQRHNVRHAIATTNCTTALHLSLVALGIKPGDEVVVPAFTWVATANVVMYCGATPVFVDVHPQTFNIDSRAVADAVTDKTKAIIAVHLFGLCADVDALAKVAPGIPIVEDAACAVGASFGGRSAGSLGRVGCFSFHPRKCISTGEGGMVTTNDDGLAETIIMLRNHGACVPEEVRHHGPKPHILPEFNLLGYNCRMTDLQGAVGKVQLEKLDGFLDERERWAEFYNEQLAGISWLLTPEVPDRCRHGWQSYVCRVDEDRSPLQRNEIMEQLQSRGISTRPGTHAVHTLDFYRQRFGFPDRAYPYAYSSEQQTMAIPLHNRMSKEDFQYVVEVIQSIVNTAEQACAA